MRIGNQNIDQLGSSATGAVSSPSTDSRAAAAGGAKSDTVNLSSASSLIALAKAGAASRQTQVQSIGHQVRTGTYQADASEVSQAVVQGHIGR